MISRVRVYLRDFHAAYPGKHPEEFVIHLGLEQGFMSIEHEPAPLGDCWLFTLVHTAPLSLPDFFDVLWVETDEGEKRSLSEPDPLPPRPWWKFWGAR